jgi:hypothetical protein
MVRVITITTQGDLIKAEGLLTRVRKNLPQMTREGMREWGSILERDTKDAAEKAGIQNNLGVLLGRGINYRQGKRSDTGYLFVYWYGVCLDTMRPHFVSVTRRRTRLLTWAMIAQRSSIRDKAMRVESGRLKKFSVYVKPHPFITAGYRRARPKLVSVLKRAAARAVETA